MKNYAQIHQLGGVQSFVEEHTQMIGFVASGGDGILPYHKNIL